DLQAQDDAYAEQARQQPKEEKPEPPQGLAYFMRDLPGAVPPQTIIAAIAAADNLVSGADGDIFKYTHHAVVMFALQYKQDGKPNALDDALSRLCVPLIGYAKVLDAIYALATTATGSSGSLRFADIHSLGEHVTRYFVDALWQTDLPASIYVNFLTGALSED